MTAEAKMRRRAKRLFREQPKCQNCGERGYLRFDDDCDLYVLCDICGHEQDTSPRRS